MSRPFGRVLLGVTVCRLFGHDRHLVAMRTWRCSRCWWQIGVGDEVRQALDAARGRRP